MDWETAIFLATAIISALAALYPILIGQESIRNAFPNLLQKPLAIRLSISLAILGGISLIFLLFLIPRSTAILDWVLVGDESFPTEDIANEPPLILHYNPNQLAYTPADLLSTDTFPTSIAILSTRDQKTFFAGTYGAGLFVSTNLPDWYSLGLENMVITDVIANEDGELIVATNLGIFISKDNGEFWEHKGPTRSLVTSLIIDPNNNNSWFAGTTNGIYRSSDKGQTWIGPFLEKTIVVDIVFSPVSSRRLYVSILEGSVLRSDNGGESWIQIRNSDQEGSTSIFPDPNELDKIYIGPSDEGLLVSNDAGLNWSSLGLNGTSISSISVSTSIPGLIY